MEIKTLAYILSTLERVLDEQRESYRKACGPYYAALDSGESDLIKSLEPEYRAAYEAYEEAKRAYEAFRDADWHNA